MSGRAVAKKPRGGGGERGKAGVGARGGRKLYLKFTLNDYQTRRELLSRTKSYKNQNLSKRA